MYTLSLLSQFVDWFEDLTEPLRDFVFENHANPVFWIGLFLGLAFIFFSALETLHKD